jgi:hypothetical protein
MTKHTVRLAVARLGYLGFLAYLLASAQGCASKYSVTFQPLGLTEAQVETAEAAAAEWCEASTGSCCPSIGGHGNVLTSEPVPPGKVGNTRLQGGSTRISISPKIQDLGLWYRVVRHELGHACAAVSRGDAVAESPHLSPGHVMAKSDDLQPANITPEDVAYVRGTNKQGL